MLDNFWFDSGASDRLVKNLNEHNFTLEQFRKAVKDSSLIQSPKMDGDPYIFLY
jgi:hypothetical protein